MAHAAHSLVMATCFSHFPQCWVTSNTELKSEIDLDRTGLS